jgi:malate permease and related proteins
VIAIALAALAATGLGVLAEHRWLGARRAAQRMLQLMLYGLVPFVSYVSIAHLRLTAAGGIGLALGWLLIGLIGAITWWIGRSLLRLPDRRLGALIVSAVVVNTGYLGNPIVTVLLGAHGLRSGVAWDQLVSGPALFLLGFGTGAAFGDHGLDRRAQLTAFLTRNPPLLAVLAGLIVPPSWAPAPLPRLSHLVVDGLLVLGFFAAGVYLASERRAEHGRLLQLPDRPVLVVLGVRLLLAPVLLLALSAATVAVPTAYLIQSAMPTGLSSLIVGHSYGLDQRLIATSILWSSLVVVVVALAVGAA